MKRRMKATIFGLVFVLVVVSIAGAAPQQTFNDVPPGHQFYQFIEDFAQLGITGGCGGGNYCPSNVTTRGQMAVFVVRLWKLTTTGTTSGPLYTSPPWIRTSMWDVRTALNGDTVNLNDVGGNWAVRLDPDAGYYDFWDPSGSGPELWVYDGTGNVRQELNGAGSVKFHDSRVDYYDSAYNLMYQYTNGVHYGDQSGGESDFAISARDDFLVNVDSSNDSFGGLCVVDGNGIYAGCLNENGNFWAGGTKSAAVDTASYGNVKLYAVEATENWFEDFGSAQLNNGAVEISIDPIFAETVNLNEEYHVLTTAQCDQPAVLFVSSKTPSSFVVQGRDLANQPSSCAFSYRISAKRLGYEHVRMDLEVKAAGMGEEQHTPPPPAVIEHTPRQHDIVRTADPEWADHSVDNPPVIDMSTLLTEGEEFATE